MRLLLLILLLLAARLAPAADLLASVPRDCRQLVLVTARDWSASRGELRRYERADGETAWRRTGAACGVLLGERGLAWGLGLHAAPGRPGPSKREGDRRAPAGIFELPMAFGTGAKPRRMPYRPLAAGIEAVDDPRSRFYNQIVQRREIPRPDWRSSERMHELPDYTLGVVIAHNPRHVPGAGSCIFIHLWSAERAGTAGCTALRAEDLHALVDWLDARRHPVLMQLPEFEVPRAFPR